MSMKTKTLQPGRGSSPGRSPEFEFWMVRNPSFPQPNIVSADELIVNGVLLPLHLINKTQQPPPPEPSPSITDSTATLSMSKRWKDIFKKTHSKKSPPELNININIWPFSRSRSAGNAGTRPKLFAPTTRKANSAPCSRSNSASRKWPSSPARPGVHLGRSSPVWHVRRPKNPPSLNLDKPKRESRRSKLASTATATATSKSKGFNLNVPTCIGYRHHFTCTSHHANTNVGGKLFNLRTLFSKKTVVTSH
ncbi:hypothetical protein VNO78_22514 [Psophocarpus tetragonolobus]|uniref:Uncharacterized protein n=1 Tax=Psophocarpus tetragonolobus TaxID=3891 RepID=A0AAN9S1R7_PSOTE